MKQNYTPIFQINHDGVDITDRFNDRLVTTQILAKPTSDGSDVPDVSVGSFVTGILERFRGASQ